VLDGYTIAQVSDLHTGVMVGERELAEGFERVAQIRPDLVVATGDLVDFDASYAPLIGRVLAEARARDGVYAIFGNHDYYTGADEVLEAVDRAGVELLVNAGKRIRPLDGGGFALLGVDDLWARRSGGRGPDLERAIAMVPEGVPRVLLAHQPQYLNSSYGRVALQLSGHTHGGQINPGFHPAKLFMPYVSGRYEKNGTVMWVNRGFGVVGPPARIGAPPEVTKIILVSA
jgi:predicted MPP superfamily phosphohydrolase